MALRLALALPALALPALALPALACMNVDLPVETSWQPDLSAPTPDHCIELCVHVCERDTATM